MTTHFALQNPFHWPRHFAAYCIGAYQRHLSPRKGFRCAHRVLHGAESCSKFAKNAVLQQGIWVFFSVMRARFRECGCAAQILREHALKERALRTNEEPFETSSHLPAENAISEANKSRRKNGNHCCDGIDCTSFSCDLLSCLPDIACGAADTSALECGALDCAGCCSWP